MVLDIDDAQPGGTLTERTLKARIANTLARCVQRDKENSETLQNLIVIKSYFTGCFIEQISDDMLSERFNLRVWI